ncbi:UNVERIFIED_CONTAM: hypothetical protein Slati_0388400 [Sesamum latifolium]|uniref:Reverse transcriptase Ty1/copia-type domain-containing protein n=1 Tax=Sesamum latifolium TaxID=2727402 RepID=A0AAW2XU74_9LAMI
MSNIDSDKWLEAIKSEINSMGSNQVWTLVVPPKGARPIGCKLVYKSWYDYEIWQMDVKTAFLNDFVEEEIIMDQPEVIRSYDFIKNDYDPCIYKKISGSSVAYLVLYVDDILLIGNDVKMLGYIKAWLSIQFSMKDMGEASYILGIKIYKDRSRRMLGLTQSSYIEKVLKRFKMEHSKQ